MNIIAILAALNPFRLYSDTTSTNTCNSALNERNKTLAELRHMIAKTRNEADELEAQGRHDLARRYRNLCDQHEIRIKLTLLR